MLAKLLACFGGTSDHGNSCANQVPEDVHVKPLLETWPNSAPTTETVASVVWALVDPAFKGDWCNAGEGDLLVGPGPEVQVASHGPANSDDAREVSKLSIVELSPSACAMLKVKNAQDYAQKFVQWCSPSMGGDASIAGLLLAATLLGKALANPTRSCAGSDSRLYVATSVPWQHASMLAPCYMQFSIQILPPHNGASSVSSNTHIKQGSSFVHLVFEHRLLDGSLADNGQVTPDKTDADSAGTQTRGDMGISLPPPRELHDVMKPATLGSLQPAPNNTQQSTHSEGQLAQAAIQAPDSVLPPEALWSMVMAAEVPCLVTLLTPWGEVLYQNDLSREYYGDIVSAAAAFTKYQRGAQSNTQTDGTSDTLRLSNMSRLGAASLIGRFGRSQPKPPTYTAPQILSSQLPEGFQLHLMAPDRGALLKALFSVEDSEVDEDERVVVRQLSKVRVEIESAEEAAQGATGERISGDGAGRSLNVARNSLLAEMLGEVLEQGLTWTRVLKVPSTLDHLQQHMYPGLSAPSQPGHLQLLSVPPSIRGAGCSGGMVLLDGLLQPQQHSPIAGADQRATAAQDWGCHSGTATPRRFAQSLTSKLLSGAQVPPRLGTDDTEGSHSRQSSITAPGTSQPPPAAPVLHASAVQTRSSHSGPTRRQSSMTRAMVEKMMSASHSHTPNTAPPSSSTHPNSGSQVPSLGTHPQLSPPPPATTCRSSNAGCLPSTSELSDKSAVHVPDGCSGPPAAAPPALGCKAAAGRHEGSVVPATMGPPHAPLSRTTSGTCAPSEHEEAVSGGHDDALVTHTATRSLANPNQPSFSRTSAVLRLSRRQSVSGHASFTSGWSPGVSHPPTPLTGAYSGSAGLLLKPGASALLEAQPQAASMHHRRLTGSYAVYGSPLQAPWLSATIGTRISQQGGAVQDRGSGSSGVLAEAGGSQAAVTLYTNLMADGGGMGCESRDSRDSRDGGRRSLGMHSHSWSKDIGQQPFGSTHSMSSLQQPPVSRSLIQSSSFNVRAAPSARHVPPFEALLKATHSAADISKEVTATATSGSSVHGLTMLSVQEGDLGAAQASGPQASPSPAAQAHHAPWPGSTNEPTHSTLSNLRRTVALMRTAPGNAHEPSASTSGSQASAATNARIVIGAALQRRASTLTSDVYMSDLASGRPVSIRSSDPIPSGLGPHGSRGKGSAHGTGSFSSVVPPCGEVPPPRASASCDNPWDVDGFHVSHDDSRVSCGSMGAIRALAVDPVPVQARAGPLSSNAPRPLRTSRGGGEGRGAIARTASNTLEPASPAMREVSQHQMGKDSPLSPVKCQEEGSAAALDDRLSWQAARLAAQEAALAEDEERCALEAAIADAQPHVVNQAVMESASTALGGSWCWHEVTVKSCPDPVNGGTAMLLVQRNVTERAQLENTLSELTEAQLAMLSQIFPRHVIEALSMGNKEDLDMEQIAKLARSHTSVTILFSDLVGFTKMSQQVPPERVITFLNNLFGHFDRLLEKHRVQKIDTIGDAYLVASGILSPDEEGFNAVDDAHDAEEGARRVFAFAQDMLRVSRLVSLPHNGEPVSIRVGIHTGPCVSGLIGTKLPKWTVLGGTINTAARAEQTCQPNHVQVTEATLHLLGDQQSQLQPTGGVFCKGLGMLDTYLWAPPEGWEHEELPLDFFDGHLGEDERFSAEGCSASEAGALEGEDREAVADLMWPSMCEGRLPMLCSQDIVMECTDEGEESHSLVAGSALTRTCPTSQESGQCALSLSLNSNAVRPAMSREVDALLATGSASIVHTPLPSTHLAQCRRPRPASHEPSAASSGLAVLAVSSHEGAGITHRQASAAGDEGEADTERNTPQRRVASVLPRPLSLPQRPTAALSTLFPTAVGQQLRHLDSARAGTVEGQRPPSSASAAQRTAEPLMRMASNVSATTVDAVPAVSGMLRALGGQQQVLGGAVRKLLKQRIMSDQSTSAGRAPSSSQAGTCPVSGASDAAPKDRNGDRPTIGSSTSIVKPPVSDSALCGRCGSAGLTSQGNALCQCAGQVAGTVVGDNTAVPPASPTRRQTSGEGNSGVRRIPAHPRNVWALLDSVPTSHPIDMPSGSREHSRSLPRSFARSQGAGSFLLGTSAPSDNMQGLAPFVTIARRRRRSSILSYASEDSRAHHPSRASHTSLLQQCYTEEASSTLAFSRHDSMQDGAASCAGAAPLSDGPTTHEDAQEGAQRGGAGTVDQAQLRPTPAVPPENLAGVAPSKLTTAPSVGRLPASNFSRAPTGSTGTASPLSGLRGALANTGSATEQGGRSELRSGQRTVRWDVGVVEVQSPGSTGSGSRLGVEASGASLLGRKPGLMRPASARLHSSSSTTGGASGDDPTSPPHRSGSLGPVGQARPRSRRPSRVDYSGLQDAARPTNSFTGALRTMLQLGRVVQMHDGGPGVERSMGSRTASPMHGTSDLATRGKSFSAASPNLTRLQASGGGADARLGSSSTMGSAVANPPPFVRSRTMVDEVSRPDFGANRF